MWWGVAVAVPWSLVPRLCDAYNAGGHAHALAIVAVY
jgi:hypothetical protein